MSAKNPFDLTDMFKAFDPEKMGEMFNPSKMFASFDSDAMKAPFDVTKLMDTSAKNFEAMVEANKSATAAYKDMMDKQMEVYGQLTSAAREHLSWVDEATGPEAMTKKAQAYGEAVEKAMTLMKKLAEDAQSANEQAFTKVKSQINDAVAEMQKKTGK